MSAETVCVALPAEDHPRGRGLRRSLRLVRWRSPAWWRPASTRGFACMHAERFEPPPYFTFEQIARLEAERHAAQAAADRASDAVCYPQRPDMPSRRPWSDAPPVDAILDESATADLVVVGTHGRRGPGRWWLGSVAERVVRAALAPVLVTRAATTPPLAVFERLALVHDGTDADADARMCAEHFAALAGGTVTIAGPVNSM